MAEKAACHNGDNGCDNNVDRRALGHKLSAFGPDNGRDKGADRSAKGIADGAGTGA